MTIRSVSGHTSIYVDNSNLFIEGQRIAEQRGEDRTRFRLNFENFMKLLRRDRVTRHVVWGGSIPPPTDTVWEHLRRINIEPVLIPRSGSGENDTVDTKIQVQMHRHCMKSESNPGTIVVATGDGAGYFKEEGFFYDIEQFVDRGWRVELVSWTHCCHRRMMDFAKTRGVFIPLERWYSEISFIQDGRRSLRCNVDEVEDWLVNPTY